LSNTHAPCFSLRQLSTELVHIKSRMRSYHLPVYRSSTNTSFTGWSWITEPNTHHFSFCITARSCIIRYQETACEGSLENKYSLFLRETSKRLHNRVDVEQLPGIG